MDGSASLAEADAPETGGPEPSKGKRGRKRKSLPEAGAPEPKANIIRMGEAPEPVRCPVVAWTSEEQIAPVARMV